MTNVQTSSFKIGSVNTPFVYEHTSSVLVDFYWILWILRVLTGFRVLIGLRNWVKKEIGFTAKKQDFRNLQDLLLIKMWVLTPYFD